MGRGRLRIYLGAAPGVGKTVAMLSEGVRRAKRGTDVVVALCETHGRPHTMSMLEGLEVIPRRTVVYRGATFEEMDLDAVLAPVRAAFAATGEAESLVLGLCIQLEAEAALLDEESRVEMLEALGLGEGALPAFLHTAYSLLGLRTFFTTGEKETRAWTFRAGSTAPQTAGVIHTDFERGFIRAEVIHWDELVEIGSWSGARDAGRMRVEGKDYRPVDGDVMEFRFNV